MLRKSIIATGLAFILSAAAALLLVMPGAAGDSSAHATPQPALWKIDGPAGHVYFFGSIHILPKDYTWRTPELEAALTAAQQLVFELDIDQARDMKTMGGLIARLGLLPAGQSLHKMLAPERRAQFDTVAKSLGLDPARLDRMRPWLAAITLSTLSIAKQNTKPGEQFAPGKAMQASPGVDVQLWNWAQSAGKERAALETLEDQLSIFADLSQDQEVAFLVVSLDEVEKTPKSIAAMIDAWKTGNTGALDQAFNADWDSFPALRKALLHDRHEKWLPQIERMMSDGRTHLIIVGTAHLVGKDSVIAMLRAKGIKVEGP